MADNDEVLLGKINAAVAERGVMLAALPNGQCICLIEREAKQYPGVRGLARKVLKTYPTLQDAIRQLTD